MKIIVIRSEVGKIISSELMEGELDQIVKKKSEDAMKEWNPETSDFIVLRDIRELELPLPLDPELVDILRNVGTLSRTSEKAIARIPVYTISFENMMIGEDNYVEHKIYLISPYINDDIKTELEKEAVEITTEKAAPEGIEEEGEEEEK
ncbi:hypothetical protein Calag_1138 [Caldisphaera lagunensis DSM 15908]|uniref:DUF2286 domain-containing protein n=1 Tax=Caldisphaera lagunensis (strain DSM 15908 / JCM 11604 / ANMR 0165 / IC-154) TaxID=1056495 RepID=L0ACS7_CALLD|nr:DUF2286 domain-containing protein [Caldisphaera lagunensis]AFZ70860.1 hypothetical protein Calag_1138 [Caldisphaera lagunensis DSM 15908]